MKIPIGIKFMRELGMVLVGGFIFTLFFVGVIYPDIEYKNYPSNSTCTGIVMQSMLN